MPQLITYFYVNQASYTALALGLLVFASAKFLLPFVLSLQVTRTYITSL